MYDHSNIISTLMTPFWLLLPRAMHRWRDIDPALLEQKNVITAVPPHLQVNSKIYFTTPSHSRLLMLLFLQVDKKC